MARCPPAGWRCDQALGSRQSDDDQSARWSLSQSMARGVGTIRPGPTDTSSSATHRQDAKRYDKRGSDRRPGDRSTCVCPDKSGATKSARMSRCKHASERDGIVSTSLTLIRSSGCRSGARALGLAMVSAETRSTPGAIREVGAGKAPFTRSCAPGLVADTFSGSYASQCKIGGREAGNGPLRCGRPRSSAA